ncbi:MAG: hypothetical protein C0467_24175 [Planctomycetaceae bacterium]|nr:hypothetical protein [Planctomycetaceae bacterium]
MPVVATAKQSRVSLCRVRGQSIALDITCVRGVERAERMVPVAEQWPQVGSLPTRTGDIPVFSLAGLLGLPETDARDGTQLLLADTPGGPVGLLIEQTSQGSGVAPEAFLRMPEIVRSPHFSAVVRTQSALLPWLDLVSIFTGQFTRELPAPASWRHRSAATAQNRLMVISLPKSAAEERAWAIGLPAAVVAELVEPEGIVPVPGTADFVAGVRSWHDRVIGVIDLCAWLGLPAVGGGKSLVAVVAVPGGAEPIGLLIPRSVRMLKLPIPNLSSERVFPGTAERTVVPVEVGDETIGLIDLTSLTHGTLASS